MTLQSFRRFEIEMNRLERLYHATIHSYKLASETLINKSLAGEINLAQQFELSENVPRRIPTTIHPKALENQLSKQISRHLIEVIFVRLISALEVFLIDLLREVFLNRRDLFHSQNRIEFTQGEILSSKSITELWSKLINRELRKLQNQGFLQKAKYFKNRLDIDFNKFESFPKELNEMHDRRHLLVHRLGKTDSKYRQEYSTNNTRIITNDEYFNHSFKILYRFGYWLTDEVSKVIDEEETQSRIKDFQEIQIVIEPTTQKAQDILTPEFCFEVQEQIVMLADIANINLVDNTVEITLKGKKRIVKGYINVLRKNERRGELKIVRRETIRSFQSNKKPRKINLPISTVEEIAKSLPKQPWKQGIHKRVAKVYNVSNNHMSAIFNEILSNEEMLKLIGSDPKFE